MTLVNLHALGFGQLVDGEGEVRFHLVIVKG